MKRIALILATFLLASSRLLADEAPSIPADSTAYAALSGILQRYYDALLPASVEEKCAEMDFLLESCSNSVLRDKLFSDMFFHYKDSPLMGEEAVALYLYDKWYVTGKTAFGSDENDFEAHLFADFNRLSMLYEDAPELVLRGPQEQEIVFPDEEGLNLIFFYDTSCSKCKAVTSLLPSTLEAFFEVRAGQNLQPLKLYMVYTGSDRQSWEQYMQEFKVSCPSVQIVHAWDPEIDSDYQIKYAVISTPKMYLVTSGGMIIGRRLELDSMVNVMDYYYLYAQDAKEEK